MLAADELATLDAPSSPCMLQPAVLLLAPLSGLSGLPCAQPDGMSNPLLVCFEGWMSVDSAQCNLSTRWGEKKNLLLWPALTTTIPLPRRWRPATCSQECSASRTPLANHADRKTLRA